jgi:hypothetical protein
LSNNINKIAVNYKITQADWNRYLSDIAITINDNEGKISNLSLKVLAGGGSYLALKPLVAPLVLKVGRKVLAKLASKAGAKIATKTGAVVAGKVGTLFLDATVGVGIIIWDVWENNHTANIEKPILHDNIATYLQELKNSLLNNSENGIMTVMWKRYLNQLANVVYDTVNSKFSFSQESITSSMLNDLLIVTTTGIGGKFALNFATKAATKIAAKAGGTIATKVVTQMVDPMLAVGILIWDTWDYNRMVNESRPVLRQNILSHLNEVKMTIYEAPDNSIMTAIEEVKNKIITGLESRRTFEPDAL